MKHNQMRQLDESGENGGKLLQPLILCQYRIGIVVSLCSGVLFGTAALIA
jgi:hypothetical protein